MYHADPVQENLCTRTTLEEIMLMYYKTSIFHMQYQSIFLSADLQIAGK